MSISLEQIVPWGRSMEEYELMFNLTPDEQKLRILGCGDGPSSFNAEMTEKERHVISIDPIYQFSGYEIRERFDATANDIITQVKNTPDDWVWACHRDPEHLRENRCRVIEKFLADYEKGRSSGRYLTASLPTLPFKRGEFDLALCSHLLFLYSDLLSEEFHVRSILELCRVAKEVRVFPLLSLQREYSPYVKTVCETLQQIEIKTEIVTVHYELQKGDNKMLRAFRV